MAVTNSPKRADSSSRITEWILQGKRLINCALIENQSQWLLTFAAGIQWHSVSIPCTGTSMSLRSGRRSRARVCPHRGETAGSTFDCARPRNCWSTDSDDPCDVCNACRCDNDGHAVADRSRSECRRSIRCRVHCRDWFSTHLLWCASQRSPSDWREAAQRRDRRRLPLDETCPVGRRSYWTVQHG